MIAIGIAPGIRSLAYCALEWDGHGTAQVLDQDVLSRPKLIKGDPNPALLAKRFHCHRLILTTVWDRHVPTILSIGPQCDPAEPELNAIIAGTILAEFGRFMGATVVRAATEQEIMVRLHPGVRHAAFKKSLRTVLRRSVPSLPKDRRGLLAAAAAAYGLCCESQLFLSAKS